MTANAIDLEIGRHVVALARQEWGRHALEPIGPHLSALLPLEPACELQRRFHVVQTHAQKEGEVAAQIVKAKMDSYDPREPKSIRVNAVKRRIVKKPILVGYTLAGFDPKADPWEQIDDMRGVIRLFKFDERPVPVPDEAVERIRLREIEVNNGGRVPASVSPVKVGEWVQIIDHPSYSGLIGLVIEVMLEKWRCIVELDFFGQKVPHELSLDQVRLVG